MLSERQGNLKEISETHLPVNGQPLGLLIPKGTTSLSSFSLKMKPSEKLK